MKNDKYINNDKHKEIKNETNNDKYKKIKNDTNVLARGNLEGTLEDATKAVKFFRRYYGFNIQRKFMDNDPSVFRKNVILGALEKLFNENDICLIYYSGHGRGMLDHYGDFCIEDADEIIQFITFEDIYTLWTGQGN